MDRAEWTPVIRVPSLQRSVVSNSPVSPDSSRLATKASRAWGSAQIESSAVVLPTVSAALVAEQAREALVDLKQKAVAEPRDHHDVGGGLESGGELLLGLAQLAFGPHPLADVVGDGRDPRDLAPGVADRGEREHDVDKAAVPAQVLRLEAEAALAAQQARDERLRLALVARRQQQRPVASDRLLGRVAVEDLGGGFQLVITPSRSREKMASCEEAATSAKRATWRRASCASAASRAAANTARSSPPASR
jgi:hypothetical protein